MATSDAMAHTPAQQDSSVADSVTELLSDQAHDRKRRKTESVPESVCVMDVARIGSIGADSVEFTDALLSNSAFLQSLSARDIVSLKGVCTSWAAWVPANIKAISDAHRLENNHDWIFPVIAEPDLRTPTSLSLSLSLSGISHTSADQSSGKLLRASPTLDYLPHPPPNCRLLRYDIIASSDGLLLVKALSVSLMAPDHTRRRLQENACYRCQDYSLGRKWDWESLTVINPLTEQFRVLPAFKGESLNGWTSEHAHGVQAQITVDAEANSYKVLYYECAWELVYVYDSKSDIWQGVQYHSHTGLPKLGDYCTSAKLDGRLYFADIREATPAERFWNPRLGAVVRLFEIDIGTGHWTAPKDFPLCKWHDWRIPELGVTPEFNFNKNVLINWELVECMGHLFAVIPARLDEVLQPLHSMRARLWIPDILALDLEYIMPLQFYIFQLMGEEGEGVEDLHSGVLRIELPRNSKTCKDKRQLSLYVKTSGAREPAGILDPRPNWYSCTARGSVIWVSCEDYLLQYDVKSGQSKTQLLPKRRMQRCDHQMRLAYMPSFHMKP